MTVMTSVDVDGRVFRDTPDVVHVGLPGTGAELRPGMSLMIEPVLNARHPDTKTFGDGSTAVTRDRNLSAQFEQSIGNPEICAIFKLSAAECVPGS